MHTQNQHLICTQCGCCCTGAQPLGLHASCAQAETAPYLLYAVRSLLYRCAASGFAGLFVFGSVRRLWIEVSSVLTCIVTKQEGQQKSNCKKRVHLYVVRRQEWHLQ